jgi:hypothetical protein
VKRHVFSVAVVVLALSSGCSRASDDSSSAPVAEAAAPATESTGTPCTESAGTNLLINPSFEEGTTLAGGWTNESSTAGQPAYTLSTTTGVVDGAKAQRMQYSGRDGDDGTKKAEFYQGPVEGITPGETVRFSVCVCGSGAEAMTKAYAIIGVEAFKPDKTYISDVSTNITAVDTIPTRYSREYTIPDGAGYLSVFVQAPEFAAESSIDLYFDEASLVVE